MKMVFPNFSDYPMIIASAHIIFNEIFSFIVTQRRSGVWYGSSVLLFLFKQTLIFYEQSTMYPHILADGVLSALS